MVRTIVAAAQTASEAASGYSMVLAAELDFESGFIRAHTGAGTIAFPDGRQFTGVGSLASIGVVEEQGDLRASNLELALSGIESSSVNVSSVLTEDLRNRDGALWLVFIDGDGAVVADPVKIFAGRLDNFIVRQGSQLSVGVRIESILARWERSRELRYTNEQQRAMFPGDEGLEFVAQMVEKELVWGKA